MNTEQLAHFLSNSQYTDNGILRYEWIFGPGFISTGGPTTTTKLFEEITIPKGARVLDVGCGIGGGDVFIAEKFDATVVGVDLAETCIKIAKERHGDHPSVEFHLKNIFDIELEENSFDVIYSRDAIIHIPEKVELFTRFHKWLKPGGKVIITDYNAPKPRDQWTEEFAEYIKQREYALVPHDEYADCLRKAGLVVEKAENTTPWFVEILHKEMQHLENTKEDFLKIFSQKDYDDLMEGWQAKVARCSDGLQAWGMFIAHKPE